MEKLKTAGSFLDFSILSSQEPDMASFIEGLNVPGTLPGHYTHCVTKSPSQFSEAGIIPIHFFLQMSKQPQKG